MDAKLYALYLALEQLALEQLGKNETDGNYLTAYEAAAAYEAALAALTSAQVDLFLDSFAANVLIEIQSVIANASKG